MKSDSESLLDREYDKSKTRISKLEIKLTGLTTEESTVYTIFK